jgi:hypothetical protein
MMAAHFIMANPLETTPRKTEIAMHRFNEQARAFG